jgi:Zn-dependent peptidase ImmA (M78 family)
MSEAARRAEQVVADLSIRDPADLDVQAIAWELGAFVREEPLDGAAARVARYGDKAIITVSTRLREPGQRRFAVAHELGHLVLHGKDSALCLCLEIDLEMNARASRRGVGAAQDREHDANRFASALLMPTNLFQPRCNGTLCFATIEGLIEAFKASLTATAIRYIDFCKELGAVVYSQNRRIKWYRPTKDFDLHVKVGDEVDPYSIADDCFSGKTVPRRPTRVDASSWLASGYKNDATILEESRSLTSYEAVLTLLHIDQDIEPEWEPQESFTPDGRYRRR